MKEFFKNLVNNVWAGLKIMIPDRVKALLVRFLNKNYKVFSVVYNLLPVVKAVGVVTGVGSVVETVNVIFRIINGLKVTNPELVVPETVNKVITGEKEVSLEEVKVAIRDLVKLVASYKESVKEEFVALSDSEKNMAIEIAYNMVKPEIKEMTENVSEFLVDEQISEIVS